MAQSKTSALSNKQRIPTTPKHTRIFHFGLRCNYEAHKLLKENLDTLQMEKERPMKHCQWTKSCFSQRL